MQATVLIQIHGWRSRQNQITKCVVALMNTWSKTCREDVSLPVWAWLQWRDWPWPGIGHSLLKTASSYSSPCSTQTDHRSHSVTRLESVSVNKGIKGAEKIHIKGDSLSQTIGLINSNLEWHEYIQKYHQLRSNALLLHSWEPEECQY